ncbi:MAG: type III-B CRISPR-associated protein Cas10/Cmr2 [Anaerolineae bacterium]
MTEYSHILIFSIGPVQSFIAGARRTIDLYAGSQMLAQVAVPQPKLSRTSGGELIYPFKESFHCGDMVVTDTPNIINGSG